MRRQQEGTREREKKRGHCEHMIVSGNDLLDVAEEMKSEKKVDEDMKEKR